MGSSLLLKGGTNTPKSIEESFSLANTFVAGDAIRYDIPSSTWVKAQADSAENSEVAGVVSAASFNTFDLTYSGFIQVSALSGVSAPVLFLDSTIAGGLTTSPPSAIGTVIKPVLTKTTNGAGYIVTNYLGTQIGGSSTVAIDEIQPVGTVVPFAGSVIPDSWLECNGASYAVSAYPNLYAKLQYSGGDRQPAYGSVCTLNMHSTSSAVTSSAAVGNIAYINNRTSTASGVTPTYLAHDFVAQVVRVEPNTLYIQILPKYNSTTKSFSYPNTTITEANYTGGLYSTLSLYSSLTSTTNLSTAALVNESTLTHFNTPDLRGRFAIGANTTAIGDSETETLNNSAISGIYSIGSEGGEEKNSLPTAGAATSTGTNCVANVANNLLNNIPPYTVVRYIIKASPYTRAAIIDGIDIPYTSLLVSDLRDGSLRPGGSGEDLVFKTNDGSSGVERMRLTNTPTNAAPGSLVVGESSLMSGYNTAYRLLDVAKTTGDGGGVVVTRSASVSLESGVDESSGSGIIGTRTTHPLIFRTNTTERMRVDANGQANIRSTVNSTSTTTGGLTLGGGLGMASNLTVGGGISTAGGITASRLNVSTAGIFTRATGNGLDTNGNITMNGGGVFSITSSGNNNVMTMEGSGFEATMRFKDFWTGNSYQGKGPQIGSDANRFIIRTFDTTRVTITSSGVGISNVWIPTVARFNWTRVGPNNNTTSGFAPLSNGVRAPLVNSADGIANQQYSMIVYFTEYSYLPGDGLVIKRFDNIPANALLVFSNDGIDLYSVNGVVQLDSSGAAKPAGNNGWHSQGSIVFYRTT